MGRFPMHHVVPRLLGTPARSAARAEARAHNREVLGVNDQEYRQLLEKGIVCE